MIEIIVTVLLEVAKCLSVPLGRRFGYLRNHNGNFDDLNEGVGKLKLRKDEVQRKVDDALKNVEEIKPEVKEWQNKVDSIIDEAEKLIEDKGNNRCLKGLCPDLKTRYKNSKEASTKVGAIARLLQEEEKFVSVSRPVSHEDISLFNKDFEAFESRNSVLENIMDALKDEKLNMVGVHGMGGIGKTTLVKEVGRLAKKEKLFDEVVFVEISENPNINKIQEEIAGRLNLKLDDKPTESQRADKLHARLKNEKILLILDNIWTVHLDLKAIGIPSQADHCACKFLLTSRIRDVLDHMGSKSFLIGVLEELEAWNLFKKMAGVYIENPEIKYVAVDVVKECAGLPVAIVTVARALKSNKELFEWKDSLRELRRPAPENFTGVLEKAYSKIEFSYNKLKDEKLKETFLLCSIMENKAPTSDLFKYVIGLNILGKDILEMEEARNKVKTWVRQLIDSCLLLKNDASFEYFSMHDVVRDVAISIARRDQHLFTERNYGLREWPDKDELKKCMKISLLDAKIAEPPEELECPELEFFYVSTKNSCFKIPDNFFVGMTKLGVLDIPRARLSSLPSSFCHLVNLETLCLDYGKFGDKVTIIGELKKLKILSMKGSNITHIPKEIGQLTQLRLLDVSDCSNLKIIAPDLIKSLSRLEELYMIGCPVQWEVEEANVERSNASLDELKHLPNLTTLEVEIKDDKILPNDLFSKELQRYNISVGDVRWNYWFKNFKVSRTLKIKLISNISLKVLQGLKNVESLYLDELKGVENLLYELDEEGFPQLKHLDITNSPNFDSVLYLRNSIPCDAFPLLESLFLYNLINLEQICHSQLRKESFCNLKIINVSNCSKLENIFSFSHVKCLPKLERIHVRDCHNMKEIFAIGSEDNGNNNEVIDKFELCKLRDLSLSSLPQLARFYYEIKTPSTRKKIRKELTTESQSSDNILGEELDTPTSLFNNTVVFPTLEKLSLYHVNSECIWDSKLPRGSCCYQNLTRFTLMYCQRLKYAFPSSIVRSFEQLQHLDITNCWGLKEIVAEVRDEADAAPVFVFPRLTHLCLWNLPNLETFYPGLHKLEWPMLKKLEVANLGKIKVLNSDYPSSDKNNKEDHLDISRSQSLFLAAKINPSVEELSLGGKSIIMMCHSQFLENYSRFKVIELVDDESTTIPFGFLHRFNNMEELQLRSVWYKEIFSCEEHVGMLKKLKVLKLTSLFDLKYMVELDSKLNLVLQNLEILKVWNCNKLIKLVPSSTSFQNLTALNVSFCDGLMKLVTPATAKTFGQLREIDIEGCKMMKEIVANEGDVEKEEIVFSKLKRLSLARLRSLKSFCSGNYILKFPSLEDFIVVNCPEMMTFCKGVLSTPRLQEVKLNIWYEPSECWEVDLDLNITIQQLYETLDTSWDHLTLNEDEIRIMLEDQFSEQYSCPIKVLEVFEDKSMNISLKILHGFNDLEKLIITTSSYKEIFSCEDGERKDKMLAQIKVLELCGLPNLTDMWRQDSEVDSILPNLEVLKVYFCHNLIILLPSLASFQNLTTLKVRYCNGLRNLAIFSTAKSLVQLEKMKIEDCEMMVEIVANEEDVANEEVVFSKLKVLILWNLKSLTSFYSGNCTFKFPSLEDLRVIKCPKMKTFCEGVLSTPRLQKVEHQHWGQYEECWEGDLNKTIQQLYKKVINVPSCEKDLGEIQHKF